MELDGRMDGRNTKKKKLFRYRWDWLELKSLGNGTAGLGCGLAYLWPGWLAFDVLLQVKNAMTPRQTRFWPPGIRAFIGQGHP